MRCTDTPEVVRSQLCRLHHSDSFGRILEHVRDRQGLDGTRILKIPTWYILD